MLFHQVTGRWKRWQKQTNYTSAATSFARFVFRWVLPACRPKKKCSPEFGMNEELLAEIETYFTAKYKSLYKNFNIRLLFRVFFILIKFSWHKDWSQHISTNPERIYRNWNDENPRIILGKSLQSQKSTVMIFFRGLKWKQKTPTLTFSIENNKSCLQENSK